MKNIIIKYFPKRFREILQFVWRRVPPRDGRFLLHSLDDGNVRRHFLKSKSYTIFLDREARHWSSQQQESPVLKGLKPSAPAATGSYRHFLEHPIVKQEFHRRACPESADTWEWLKKHYVNYGHGLVIGAGDGSNCRMLIDLGIAREVTAIDIANGTIEKAKASFKKENYPIRYMYGDLNTFEIRNCYDLCLSMYAMHHIVDIEHLVGQIARGLQAKQGILILEDYVGPRYLEYPTSIKNAAQHLFRSLPDEIKIDPAGKGVIKKIHFADRWEVQRQSPFEAIRSDRIIPLIKEHFHFVEYHPMGGGIAMPLLNQIIHNCQPENVETDRIIGQILDVDMAMTKEGKIPNCFAFIVAHPKAIKNFG